MFFIHVLHPFCIKYYCDKMLFTCLREMRYNISVFNLYFSESPEKKSSFLVHIDSLNILPLKMIQSFDSCLFLHVN